MNTNDYLLAAVSGAKIGVGFVSFVFSVIAAFALLVMFIALIVLVIGLTHGVYKRARAAYRRRQARKAALRAAAEVEWG